MQLDEFLELIAKTLDTQEEISFKQDTELSGIWDSLGQIGVLAMLDKNFNVKLAMDELVSLKTVQDIIDILDARGVQFDKGGANVQKI